MDLETKEKEMNENFSKIKGCKILNVFQSNDPEFYLNYTIYSRGFAIETDKGLFVFGTSEYDIPTEGIDDLKNMIGEEVLNCSVVLLQVDDYKIAPYFRMLTSYKIETLSHSSVLKFEKRSDCTKYLFLKYFILWNSFLVQSYFYDKDRFKKDRTSDKNKIETIIVESMIKDDKTSIIDLSKKMYIDIYGDQEKNGSNKFIDFKSNFNISLEEFEKIIFLILPWNETREIVKFLTKKIILLKTEENIGKKFCLDLTDDKEAIEGIIEEYRNRENVKIDYLTGELIKRRG